MRNLFIPCNGPGLRGRISVPLAISLKEEIHARQSQHDNVHELILTMT